MLISGELNVDGIKAYFIRKVNSKGTSWYIFKKEAEINGKTYRVSIDALLEFKFSNLKPFLLSAQKVTMEDYQIFGNPYLAEKVIKEFTNAQGVKYEETIEEKKYSKEGMIQKVSCKSGDRYLTTEVLYSGLVFKDNELTKEKEEIAKSNLDETNIFNQFKEMVKSNINNKLEKENKKTQDKIKFNGELISINFKSNDVELKTFNHNKKGKREPELSWENVDISLNNYSETRDNLLASNAKSLAQLRVNFDLSWFFDERGRMKKDYVIVNTLEELERYSKEVFPKIKLWSVDIETTGLNMYVGSNRSLFDHTVSIMVSWKKNQALFFPIDMVNIPNLPDGWVEILKPWLEKIKAVGHNITFDARGLYSDYGIKLKIAHDTMQLNFNINCHRAKWQGNGLKKLTHRYFGVDTLELKDIFGTSKLAGLYRHLPPTLALLYACPDVDYCLQLLYKLWEELPATSRKAYKLDMMVFEDIWKMDCIGNRVNIEEAKRYREANNKDRDLIKELIYKLAGQTIKKREKMVELSTDLANGTVREEELDNVLANFFESNEYKNARIEFDIKSIKALGEIMFNKMGYPTQGLSDKSKLPKLDAGVLKKLMDFKMSEGEEESGWLKRDVQSAFRKIVPETQPLIKKDEFNKLKYPMALLVVEYRLREKRDGTFYHQIIDGSVDARYYTSTRPANAETFRLINVIQTLQGYMKQLIVPYDDDHYMLVFDFSQIEYRYMAGIANVISLVKSLNSARADFHKECCALLHNIMPWHVTSKMRKEGKSLNFAIPFGMGDFSICKALFKKVNEKLLILARRQLHTWQEKFHEIWDYLETKRDFALANGYVENEMGRRRWFFDGSSPDSEIEKANLIDWKKTITSTMESIIRRAAGNFPIQSGAADLFKLAFHNFRRRLKEEGLEDLVKTTAIVHDELVTSVHKSVNMYFLYKIIYEECMLLIPGHPRYYAGISIVDNWYEGKADEYEAPIEFVQHQIETGAADEKFVYQKDAKNDTYNDIKKYMTNVFLKEYAELGVDFNSTRFDLANVIANATDYFLLDKVSVYYPLPSDGSKGKINKDYDNDKFIRGFEEFVLANLGDKEYHFIYPDDYPSGKEAIVSTKGRDFDFNKDAKETDTGRSFVYYIDSETLLNKDKIKKDIIENDLNEIDLLFTEMSKEEKIQREELGLDLDLDLDDTIVGDLDTEDDLDIFKDTRLNALALYEMEENETDDGLFESFNIFIDTSELRKEAHADIWKEYEENPEEFRTTYANVDSLIRLSSTEMYINIGKLYYKNIEKALEYLNNFTVEKGTLGALQIVLKEGKEYNYTGVYIKGYNIDDLNNYLGELTKELIQ